MVNTPLNSSAQSTPTDKNPFQVEGIYSGGNDLLR